MTDQGWTEDDWDDEALLAAWQEVDREAVALLRTACADVLAAPVPEPDLARAARALRGGIAGEREPYDYFTTACGWQAGAPAADEELWLTAAASTVRPPHDPLTGEPSGRGDRLETLGLPADLDEESAVAALEHADWLGLVTGLVRRGVGARFDSGWVVRDIEACPETGDVGNLDDDEDVLVTAVAVLTRRWQALGVLDEEGRLTGLGRWGLPRALERAWDDGEASTP